MVAESGRLTRLVNNVLDFSQLEQGRKRYTLRETDLVGLSRGVLETERPRLELAGFAVAFHAAEGPAAVLADEDALRQVLGNLLSNAEKYSTDRRDIGVETGAAGGRPFFRVLDRGIGIEPEHATRIFREFYRVDDSLTTRVTGHRPGLEHRAADRARSRGGALVRAARGRGQRVPGRVPGRGGTPAPAATAEGEGHGMNEKILVVDDEEAILLGVGDLLASEGYRVSTARDGREALERFSADRPDLVLLDVMMPEMSGYDVCRAIRRTDPLTPVMMLTAKAEEVDKVVGLELGADDYVVKPFGTGELTARVHAALRRAHARASRPDDRADLPAIAFGDVEIDPRTLKGRRGSCEFAVTPREVHLLRLFADHEGEALDRAAILEEVWGVRYEGTTRTLDQHIVKLRQKVEADPANPRHILTVHGVGYRFQR